MDEPTNDLDADTLELLEEMVANYTGTLLLVSHDRAFLDNVVTSTLVFEGAGQVNEYVGGYSDWLRQRKAGASIKPPAPMPIPATAPAPARASARAVPKARRLSYKEQRELEATLGMIQRLEAERLELSETVADPAAFKQDPAKGTAALRRLQALDSELEGAYLRWDALDGSASRPSAAE
jgi:ATP-binding cassette subfamily F protein uup